MSKLNLSDLKEQGLTLTKAEAHELLSAVSQHSQHTPDNGVMYGGEVKGEEAPVKKETKAVKAKAKEEAPVVQEVEPVFEPLDEAELPVTEKDIKE